MKTIKTTCIFAMLISSALVFTNCKKSKKETTDDSGSGSSNTSKKYTLVIDNGAQSVEQGKSVNYNAHLVDANGQIVSASGVSWSSSFGGFSGSTFVFNNDTTGTISASVSYEGVTYSASVPVAVTPVKGTEVFAVVPSAIIWSTNSGPIQLNTVYLGNSSASYAFSSENNSIASVSGSGQVTFNAVGSTNIKVTATINGKANVVTVPVLVVGVPEAPLPVARVVVNPALGQMFKGETLQLNAKAYDSGGNDVTGNVSFSYTVVPKVDSDNEPQTSITVNNSGLVSAVAIGNAYVKVMTNGVMGQAEIVVNPDTAIIVTPFYADLGGFDPVTLQPNPTSKTFTATTYKVDRNAYHAGNTNFLTQIANPSNLVWELPQTGVPEIDNIFNIVTLSNANNTNVTASAIPGKTGGTFIMARAFNYYVGGAAITVMP